MESPIHCIHPSGVLKCKYGIDRVRHRRPLCFFFPVFVCFCGGPDQTSCKEETNVQAGSKKIKPMTPVPGTIVTIGRKGVKMPLRTSNHPGPPLTP